jgi:hypothetical protein
MSEEQLFQQELEYDGILFSDFPKISFKRARRLVIDKSISLETIKENNDLSIAVAKINYYNGLCFICAGGSILLMAISLKFDATWWIVLGVACAISAGFFGFIVIQLNIIIQALFKNKVWNLDDLEKKVKGSP